MLKMPKELAYVFIYEYAKNVNATFAFEVLIVKE